MGPSAHASFHGTLLVSVKAQITWLTAKHQVHCSVLASGRVWKGSRHAVQDTVMSLATMEMLMLPHLGLNNPIRLFPGLPKEVKFSLISKTKKKPTGFFFFNAVYCVPHPALNFICSSLRMTLNFWPFSLQLLSLGILVMCMPHIYFSY